MVGLNTNIQIITLDTNGQNTLIKRQRLVEWIKKKHQQKTHLYDVYKKFILNITIYKLKLKG